jgi:hypothetical protein
MDIGNIADDFTEKAETVMNDMGSILATVATAPIKILMAPLKVFDVGGLNIPQLPFMGAKNGALPEMPGLPDLPVPAGAMSVIPVLKMELPDGTIQNVPIGPPLLLPEGDVSKLPPPPPGAEYVVKRSGDVSGLPEQAEILMMGANLSNLTGVGADNQAMAELRIM